MKNINEAMTRQRRALQRYMQEIRDGKEEDMARARVIVSAFSVVLAYLKEESAATLEERVAELEELMAKLEGENIAKSKEKARHFGQALGLHAKE